MKERSLLAPFIVQRLIWLPTRFTLKFLGRLEVIGLENLDKAGRNAIFAANHISEIDAFFLPATLPFWSRFLPVIYTSMEKNFYKNEKFSWRQNFYGGWIFSAMGARPVYRGLKDYSQSLPHHLRILREGGSVCIFPEGGMIQKGQVQPARGGVAYLAHMTGVPIVPVRLDGAYGLSFLDLLRRKCQLTISIGEPIYKIAEPNVSLTQEDYKKLAQEVMNKVMALKMA